MATKLILTDAKVDEIRRRGEKCPDLSAIFPMATMHDLLNMEIGYQKAMTEVFNMIQRDGEVVE